MILLSLNRYTNTANIIAEGLGAFMQGLAVSWWVGLDYVHLCVGHPYYIQWAKIRLARRFYSALLILLKIKFNGQLPQ